MANRSAGLLARVRTRFTTSHEPEHVHGAGCTQDAAETSRVHTPIAELDDTSFEEGTEGGWTVVDFWASWCRPCTTFHPLFVHAADHHTGPVRFARVDVEAAPRTASMVGVQAIPTIVLFDPDGSEVERLTGVPPMAELQRLIARGAKQAGAATP